MLTNSAGSGNSAFGQGALQSNVGGSNNSAFGQSALLYNTSGVNNVAMGTGALYSATSTDGLVAIGYNALRLNTSGTFNSAVGYSALLYNDTGNNNNAQGYYSLYLNTSGNGNTGIGTQALFRNATGSYNTAIGSYTLEDSKSSGNTAIGYAAGGGITTGSNNLVLGSTNVVLGITTGSYNTIVGTNVGGLASTTSNNIILADGQGNRRLNINELGNVGVGTTTPSSRLHVNGSVCLDLNSDGLCTDGTSAISDSRLKNNVATITDALSIVNKLNGVTYNWKKDNEFNYPVGEHKSLGLIAQEVEQVLPEYDLVLQTQEGYKMLDYSKIVGILINAVKELYVTITNMADEIITKTIKTNVLCVGNNCVNETQFGEMMQGNTVTGTTDVPSVSNVVNVVASSTENYIITSTTTDVVVDVATVTATTSSDIVDINASSSVIIP
jgi:hypothetical protein